MRQTTLATAIIILLATIVFFINSQTENSSTHQAPTNQTTKCLSTSGDGVSKNLETNDTVTIFATIYNNCDQNQTVKEFTVAAYNDYRVREQDRVYENTVQANQTIDPKSSKLWEKEITVSPEEYSSNYVYRIQVNKSE